MGIDVDDYYLNKKYFEVKYEIPTFVYKGKKYALPPKIHIFLKNPIPFGEFKEAYEGFKYRFTDGKDYGEDFKRYDIKDDDELVHDFWIFSDYVEEYKIVNSDEIQLLLPSIKTKKGCLKRIRIRSNDLYQKYFHYIEKNENDFEPDDEYYFFTTYN